MKCADTGCGMIMRRRQVSQCTLLPQQQSFLGYAFNKRFPHEQKSPKRAEKERRSERDSDSIPRYAHRRGILLPVTVSDEAGKQFGRGIAPGARVVKGAALVLERGVDKSGEPSASRCKDNQAQGNVCGLNVARE